MISKTKPFKINYFLLFSFAITKVFVAIRLVEDGKRAGGILIVSTIPLVVNF